MKVVRIFTKGLLLLTCLCFQGQQTVRMQTTTAPMSEPVIRQRLQILGYTNIQITKTNTLRYEVKATKQGQPVILSFHPQTGTIHESVAGKPAARPWTMPVEPPEKIRIERMPPH